MRYQSDLGLSPLVAVYTVFVTDPSITGKLFRAQEHANLTVSHDPVQELEGIDFDRLREKTVTKFITALTKYPGTEKTMTFNSKSAFDRFIRDHA